MDLVSFRRHWSLIACLALSWRVFVSYLGLLGTRKSCFDSTECHESAHALLQVTVNLRYVPVPSKCHLSRHLLTGARFELGVCPLLSPICMP